MLYITRLLTVIELCDPAIVSELHSDDGNAFQLMDVVELLVSPPGLWNHPLCPCAYSIIWSHMLLVWH